MPLISTLAGEVKDINPDLATLQDVQHVCLFAQVRLNEMLTHGMPLSKAEQQTEEILNEVDTILEALSREDTRASWKQEALAHVLLGRLSELEEKAYNIFLSSIEDLEHDNPLNSLAQAYQEALELKAKGEISGALTVPPVPGEF